MPDLTSLLSIVHQDFRSRDTPPVNDLRQFQMGVTGSGWPIVHIAARPLTEATLRTRALRFDVFVQVEVIGIASTDAPESGGQRNRPVAESLGALQVNSQPDVGRPSRRIR